MAAKTDLVPIKVKLCERMVDNQRRVDWPNLNKISSDIRKEMGWSTYIDMYGIGWHYDKVENLGTGADCGWAYTCVPKDFADAAEAAYPQLITRVKEADFEIFYDTRSHVYEPVNHIDHERLMGLKAALDLGGITSTDSELLKALDPNDKCGGICKNDHKTWALCKGCYLGLTIHVDYAKP